jgi:hypothetical protein
VGYHSKKSGFYSAGFLGSFDLSVEISDQGKKKRTNAKAFITQEANTTHVSKELCKHVYIDIRRASKLMS